MLTVMGERLLATKLGCGIGCHDPQAWSQCGFQRSLLDSESLNDSAIRPEFCSTSKDL